MGSQKELFKLLDKAIQILGQYSGGYSGNFLSAEEFSSALIESVEKFKAGDVSHAKNLYIWFLPTSCWDDFVGSEGNNIANRISVLLKDQSKNI